MSEHAVKFELDLVQPAPRLDGAGPVVRQDDPVKATFEGTYYDTHDHRLIETGITLRRRTGGQNTGWYLQLPRPGDRRTESIEPLGHAGEPPPETLIEQVREQTGERELMPVVRIRTTRYSHPLLDTENDLVATLLDDYVTAEVAGERTGLDAWRELEVDPADGPADELLDALAAALLRLGARPARWQSKLHRVLGSAVPTGDNLLFGTVREERPE